MQQQTATANRRRNRLAVFIGRFEPPHLGHLAAIVQALLLADIVMIVIGSANAARSFHYVPFTAAEREQMIRLMLTPEQNARVHFLHTEDQGNMPKWTSLIRAGARALVGDDEAVTLVGHAKDNSTFYLTGFRGWKTHDVDNYLGLSATDIRNIYFHPSFSAGMPSESRLFWERSLHPEVQQWLENFASTNDAYHQLLLEGLKVEQDRLEFGGGNHIAATAIVIHGDHVLTTRRIEAPFDGCDSLPGVFIRPNERVADALIRAVTEKACLKMPRPLLEKSLIRIATVDEPWRDPRGRVLDFVGLYYLNPVPPAGMTNPEEIQNYTALPRIRKNEAGIHNQWMPIASVQRERFAFDHFQDLQNALDFIPRD